MVKSYASLSIYKKIFVITSIIILIILTAFLFLNYNKNNRVIGKAILSLETDYIANESLRGTLLLSMRQGELIPADSVIEINMDGNKYDYALSDLVNNEKVVGDFYTEGKSLTGTGEGYGAIGIKSSYPQVSFEMKIISTHNKDSDNTKNNKK